MILILSRIKWFNFHTVNSVGSHSHHLILSYVWLLLNDNYFSLSSPIFPCPVSLSFPLFTSSSPPPSPCPFLSFMVSSLSPSSCKAKSQVCLWLQFRIKACISGPEVSSQDWYINHTISELAEFVSDPSLLLCYWILLFWPINCWKELFFNLLL